VMGADHSCDRGPVWAVAARRYAAQRRHRATGSRPLSRAGVFVFDRPWAPGLDFAALVVSLQPILTSTPRQHGWLGVNGLQFPGSGPASCSASPASILVVQWPHRRWPRRPLAWAAATCRAGRNDHRHPLSEAFSRRRASSGAPASSASISAAGPILFAAGCASALLKRSRCNGPREFPVRRRLGWLFGLVAWSDLAVVTFLIRHQAAARVLSLFYLTPAGHPR